MLLQPDRFGGGLFRLPVAAFEVGAQRREQRFGRALEAAALAKLTHLVGQPHRMGHDAQQGVERGKADQHQRDQEVERELDPVGMQHQQHVAGVVACGQRDCDRERGEQQDPEQRAH